MSKSEIFDNYAKIALEKGLIKNAEKSAPTKQTNPRFDSLSIKDIEKLYNVSPEKPKEMEYKQNIVEMAHPEPVVLFQSHDKINSLVENINERQNININIIHKMPNGQSIQRKYANELTLSLIRVANDMDNKNQDQLRILADHCAEQLQKYSFEFKDLLSERGEDAKDIGSGAAVGAIAGGLLGIFGGPGTALLGAQIGAVAGGALAAIFKTSPQAKNLVINAEIARTELADVIKDNPSDAFLQQLDIALLHITNTASAYAQLVDKMHMPHSTPADKANVEKVAHEYFTEIARLNILIGTFLANAKSGKYALKESDWLSKLKTPFTSILGDDVSDEVKALETLSRVIRDTQNGINNAIREAQGLSMQVNEQASENTLPNTRQIEMSKQPENKQLSEEDFGSQLDQMNKEMDAWKK